MTQKLHKLTLAQALSAQEKWHAAMVVRSRRRKDFGGDPDAVETVL